MDLIYVDDSGDEHRTLLSGLAIPEQRWSSYLKGWLTFRTQLFRRHAVPANYELHAQDWLSKSPGVLTDGSCPAILGHNRDARRARTERYEAGLQVIGSFTDARLFTVATAGTDKFGLYTSLLAWIDTELTSPAATG